MKISESCADASNAFAESKVPDIPFYVQIDVPLWEWHTSRFDKDTPDNFVLPVNKALQGHPDSSHLWAKHVDRILQEKFSLKPTILMRAVYISRKIYKNEEILFPHLGNDFVVAATNEQTAIGLIHDIDTILL